MGLPPPLILVILDKTRYNSRVKQPTRTFDLGPLEDNHISFGDSWGSARAVADLAAPARDAVAVLEAIQSLAQIRDLDTMLEQVLLHARRLVRADAGTIYIRAKNRLYFSYVQNDTLFAGQTPDSRYIYSSNTLPIDRSSLAGYVAATGESLIIDDVYDIRSTVSYSFNPEYDARTNYRTKSILTVPLLARGGTLVGVLQLINALDDSGAVVSFSYHETQYAIQFAQNAADAIERARLSRDMVLRLVQLSGLRDPYETSRHARRVGAYSVELYDRWATEQNMPRSEIKVNREIIRTAAMLHDVGKVAISDSILRKGRSLSDEEHRAMQLHTIYGARLFRRPDSPYDQVARDIALNHHERWDGTGYPGHVEDIFARKVRVGRPKRGTEIPVTARIVTIADTYDALMSRRAYKEPWPEERVIHYMETEAGGQFDPDLVRLFLEMLDVIHSITRKWSR